MKKKFKIIDTSSGEKIKLGENQMLKAKQKALDKLIQRVVSGVASEYDLNIYTKLNKIGVIK
jgi:hypothetical protein